MNAGKYVRPAYKPPEKENAAVIAWFAGRGITEETVKKAGIGQVLKFIPSAGTEIDCIAFPFYRGTQVVNVKYRGMAHKGFLQEANAEKVFYGLETVPGKSSCVITEGEIDQLSCLQAQNSAAVLSVPDGGLAEDSKVSDKKMEFLTNCYKDLQGIKKFILALDGDEKGRGMTQELARRLRKERCFVVEWPHDCKDANEVLLNYGSEVLAQILSEAQPFPVEGIIRVTGERLDEIWAERNSPHSRGIGCGWENLKENYRVVPGYITTITGIPSHGKSEFLDAIMVNMAKEHGWKFAICSPETMPNTHIGKLAAKYIGKHLYHSDIYPVMNDSEFRRAGRWLEDFFFFVEPKEKLHTLDEILKMFREVVFKYGVNGVVIDPWNQLDRERDYRSEHDYTSQSLSTISRFAKDMGVHVWIVAHPTKLKSEETGENKKEPVPGPYDISGSGTWYSKSDNIITVWRDKRTHGAEVLIDIKKIKEMPRMGNVEKTNLFYNRATTRYEEDQLM
jgi:twinkle protein